MVGVEVGVEIGVGSVTFDCIPNRIGTTLFYARTYETRSLILIRFRVRLCLKPNRRRNSFSESTNFSLDEFFVMCKIHSALRTPEVPLASAPCLTASADLFSSYEISRISSLLLLRVAPEKTVERALLRRAGSAVHGMEGKDRDRREMHRGGFAFCRTRLERADMLPTRHDAAEGDSR